MSGIVKNGLAPGHGRLFAKPFKRKSCLSKSSACWLKKTVAAATPGGNAAAADSTQSAYAVRFGVTANR